MWQATALRFAADHPTAAGHFPADPIIPGALMLDQVVAAIAGAQDDQTVLIKAAKFLQAVLPGETIALRWRTLAGGATQFECRIAGQDSLVLAGTLELGGGAP